MRPVANRWSLRHTGIYHHHNTAADFDLWIIVHPVSDSALERQLLALAKNRDVPHFMHSKIYDDPFQLHLLIYSTYLGNWRWYLQFLGNEVKRQVWIHVHLKQSLSL